MASCTPLTPPPLVARHAGAAREEQGTITVTAAIGIGAASTSGGMGFELRARWQAFDDLALGMAFGAGSGDGDPDETVDTMRLFALRVFAAANPLPTNDVGVTFGAGVSTLNTGLRAVSLDAGAVTSTTFADTVEPSLGLVAALAVPFDQGRPFGARDAPTLPTTTFYYGGSLGLALHFGSTRNVLSGEAGVLRASSISGERATALYLSAADAQGARP